MLFKNKKVVSLATYGFRALVSEVTRQHLENNDEMTLVKLHLLMGSEYTLAAILKYFKFDKNYPPESGTSIFFQVRQSKKTDKMYLQVMYQQVEQNLVPYCGCEVCELGVL